MYYFEMTVIHAGENGAIGIGLTGKGSKLNRMPGWSKKTIGYHGDNGLVYSNSLKTKKGEDYGPTFGKDDVIGCGIDFQSNTVFFTKNGRSFGIAKRNWPRESWYPTIGLHSLNEKVKVNFGQEDFVFNISKYTGNSQFNVSTSIKILIIRAWKNNSKLCITNFIFQLLTSF